MQGSKGSKKEMRRMRKKMDREYGPKPCKK